MFLRVSVSAENWLPIEEVCWERWVVDLLSSFKFFFGTKVPPSRLVEYFNQLRAEGYTIVALEQVSDHQASFGLVSCELNDSFAPFFCSQSANSVNVHDFVFPKKTVLLLGKQQYFFRHTNEALLKL